jgi:hypothetical protein
MEQCREENKDLEEPVLINIVQSTTDLPAGNYSFTAAPSQKTYRVIPSKDGFSFTPVDKTFLGLIDDQKGIDFTASAAKP